MPVTSGQGIAVLPFKIIPSLLLFRQKQQNQWGPRTRISLTALSSCGVSGKSTPLLGCGARSGERIALRTTELLDAPVSTRLLHAASVLAQTGAAPGKTRSPALLQYTYSRRYSMQKPNRTLLICCKFWINNSSLPGPHFFFSHFPPRKSSAVRTNSSRRSAPSGPCPPFGTIQR